jgi:hypothetical protein
MTQAASVPTNSTPPLPAPPLTPVDSAIAALLQALRPAADGATAVGEERSVYQPDTWLIQRCWEVLADAGAVQEALAVARLNALRQPLAIHQCLHRLSRQIDRHWGLAAAVAQPLHTAVAPLLRPDARGDAAQTDQLLYGAATAANLAERTLAFACLERLDQFHQPWQRPIVQPDQRKLLAETVLRSGPHPLTAALIAFAVRRFDDAGAQLVGEISAGASEHLRHSSHAPKMARLLALSVAAMRNSTLTTLHARRVAATIFGQAGLVSEVLAQLTTVANIQLARRESGLPGRTPDQPVLRQVKRPNANSDIDFQVHTLCQAVRAMPQARLSSEERIELANQLAMLGGQSDGWTAAGAAATLLELGAVRFAVEMVEKIPAGDPTRVEGVIELVRGLLARGDAALAREQVQKGLTWARAYPGRNPERALIWGIAEIYLERDEPQHALAILDQRRGETGFFNRLRSRFSRKLTDDELHDDGLRLRAWLLQDRVSANELNTLVTRLNTWAPRLLDGEARVSFLVDTMLKPLLLSGRTRLALSLLPTLQDALRTGVGEKHAARVAGVATALAAEFARPVDDAVELAEAVPAALPPVAPLDAATRTALEQFMRSIWQNDAGRGLWQVIHGIEGALPLLLALEGPQAVAQLAQRVNLTFQSPGRVEGA